MKNLNEQEQVICILSGAFLLAYGIFRKKWIAVAGIFPLAAGIFKYCPVKDEIHKMAPDDPAHLFSFSKKNYVTTE